MPGAACGRYRVTNGQLLEEVREPHQSDARALRVHVAMLIATPEDAFDENATERQKSRMAE
jgi:hypothetical protein